MAKAPSMPLFCGDYLGDTIGLSLEQSGAYLHILMATWANGCKPFPDDDAVLARICRVTVNRFRTRLRPAIVDFFDLSGGSWRNRRLEKEWAYVAERAAIARANGRKGGRPETPPPEKTESVSFPKTDSSSDPVCDDKSLNYNGSGNPAGSSRDTQRESTQPFSKKQECRDPCPPPTQPLTTPPGVGVENPVAYAGKSFSLNQRDFDGYRKRFWAIPDFLAAIQTFDEELVGKAKPYAALNRMLLNKHEYYLSRKQAAQPAQKSNRGRIVL